MVGPVETHGCADGWYAWASATYVGAMCRNIRTLHNFEPPATRDEVGAAATS